MCFGFDDRTGGDIMLHVCENPPSIYFFVPKCHFALIFQTHFGGTAPTVPLSMSPSKEQVAEELLV